MSSKPNEIDDVIKKSWTDGMTIAIRWVLSNIIKSVIRVLFFPVWFCVLAHGRCTTKENKTFWKNATDVVGGMWLCILILSLIGISVWGVAQL